MDEVRRLRRQLHATWAVIGVGVLVAAVPRGDDEIKARRFVVVDERGVERASFGGTDAGATTIRFEGQKDNHAASFGMNKDGRPSLFMSDPGTKGTLSFSWTSGTRSLYMLGQDGDGTKRFEVGGVIEPEKEAGPAPAVARPRKLH